MEFIIACDLEGIHGVVGEPYKTLNEAFDYRTAIEGAQLEINAVAEELFACGASKVIVWDNHGGGGNVDFAALDPRITRANVRSFTDWRGDFAKEHRADGILFLGYHAKEGTPKGVLAHTFSSKAIQYAKLDGKPIGELFVDCSVFAALGVQPIFHAGDDISVAEMKTVSPQARTVITKYGKGRNKAELRGRDEVLADIRREVRDAVALCAQPYESPFPQGGGELEVRYTRAELAEERYHVAMSMGLPVRYGEDTHILHVYVTEAKQIARLL